MLIDLHRRDQGHPAHHSPTCHGVTILRPAIDGVWRTFWSELHAGELGHRFDRTTLVRSHLETATERATSVCALQVAIRRHCSPGRSHQPHGRPRSARSGRGGALPLPGRHHCCRSTVARSGDVAHPIPRGAGKDQLEGRTPRSADARLAGSGVPFASQTSYRGAFSAPATATDLGCSRYILRAP